MREVKLMYTRREFGKAVAYTPADVDNLLTDMRRMAPPDVPRNGK